METLEFHEVANLFPLMEGDEYEVLCNDIKSNGLLEPIWLHPDGSILDGRNRYRACLQTSQEPKYEIWHGQNGQTELEFVLSKNLHRRHLNESQRAMIAARLANAPEGKPKDTAQICAVITQSEAAEMLNVSRRSVQNAAAVQKECDPETIEAVDKGELAVSQAYRAIKSIVIPEPGEQAENEFKPPHVSRNAGNNEWYTPPEYIEAACLVMGKIELDPASSEKANEIVGADVYFSIEDDGLRHHWSGNTWMNPPYAAELIKPFCKKLENHFMNGDIQQAIILVNNATETEWFSELIEFASAVVFPRGRVRFIDSNGDPGAPLQGQAVLYLGNAPETFLQIFRRFGWGAKL